MIYTREVVVDVEGFGEVEATLRAVGTAGAGGYGWLELEDMELAFPVIINGEEYSCRGDIDLIWMGGSADQLEATLCSVEYGGGWMPQESGGWNNWHDGDM